MTHYFCSGLSVSYRGAGGVKAVLSEVSMEFSAGRIVAVIGESGSGKSSLANFFAGTLPGSAEVSCAGAALPSAPALIEQEAKAGLHPLLRVGSQLRDCQGKNAHTAGKHTDSADRVKQLLSEVGLEPQQISARYPHQLSGGQAQRIAVARALAIGADMIIADEPTAHVDLLAQKRVLDVLVGTLRRYDLACLFVTHDLNIAEEIADSIAVIREGKIVEQGAPDEILYRPKAPYTRQLLWSSLGYGPNRNSSGVSQREET